MLLNSDNTAYRILYRNMSFDDLQDVLINLGLEDLFNEEGKMSSKEYTRLIRALYSATYLDEEYSQLLLDILSRTSYDAYLGQGIPDTVKFSHKIGENVDEKVISDSGVVYVDGRPYMISVMIDYSKIGHEKALQILKDISQIGYDYISTAQHEKN